jgi:hypothetical protein
MLKTLVVILVFVSAIFVLISNQPEKVFARSQDGIVELNGVSRAINSATIDSSQTIGPVFEKRISLYYLLTPEPAGLKFEPFVRVKIIEQWKQSQTDFTELSIYFFNEVNYKWEKVPTVVDLQNEILEAKIELIKPVWIAVGTL